MTAVTDLKDVWIDNGPVRARTEETFDLINPFTEARIGSAPAASAEDVDAAVTSSRRAHADSSWSDLGPGGRAALIRRLADELERRGDELGELITRQNGMPIRMVRWGNVGGTVASYRYFADLAEELPFEEQRSTPYTSTRVLREPIGTVGIIAPWNGPQILVAWKLGPALAAGCTAVLKPAPETSFDAHLLAEAARDAGFPPGVINVVTGGRDTGMALVEHPWISKVAFTGSPAAGREIGAACGRALKHVSLELGGKSAAIVLDDADLDAFGRQVTRICAPNSGQVCYSCTRILAPKSMYDSVVECVAEAMRGASLGDPMAESTNFGPLVSERQRNRVEGYIALAKDEGAELVVGGDRPTALDHGWFVSPTVFRSVDNSMRVAQEEIFGPVLVVIPYGEDADAVRVASESEYGLGGTVFSRDPERAMRVARSVETGTIGINGYEPTLDAPFGGVKSSGLGRELGPESVHAYTEFKSIYNAPSGH